jgi:hypothetical protein
MSLRSGAFWLRGGVPITALAIALAGCGKPSYCSKVSDLKRSVQQIRHIDPLSTGSTSVVHTVNGIEKSTDAAINAAKSDFPKETQALSSTYAALKGTATQVSGGRTSRANLTTLAVQAAAFANAVDDFKTATNSNCS